jgi:hypothetical protein
VQGERRAAGTERVAVVAVRVMVGVVGTGVKGEGVRAEEAVRHEYPTKAATA